MGEGTKPKTDKLDLKRMHKHLYSPSAKAVEVVDVPELLFTMVDGVIPAGEGPSDSETFARSMEAMYGVGYGLKFMSKLRKDDPIDYTVMVVEGLWSTESGEFEFGKREPWLYTLLMLQPDHITGEMFSAAVEQAASKRANPAFADVRLERWSEGPCIQIMHIGPYSEEPATLEVMDQFAADNNHQRHGRHHEIYLGDPMRAKPENLKTILRHPITSA